MTDTQKKVKTDLARLSYLANRELEEKYARSMEKALDEADTGRAGFYRHMLELAQESQLFLLEKFPKLRKEFLS